MQRSEQLDTNTIQFVKPIYSLRKVYPQSSPGQTFDIGTGGGVESIFEVPAQAFNLARSYLYFTMTAAASATLNSEFNWTFTDVVTPIRQIQLYSAGGARFVDLDNAPNYTKIVNKVETPIEEFLEYDYHGQSDVYTNSIGRFLCRNNTLTSSNTKTLAAPYGFRHDNTPSSISYI